MHYQYIQRCNICGIVVGAASKYPGPYRLHLARRLHSVIVQFHAQWQPWGVASWKIRYSAQLECSLQDCSQFGPGFDCNYLFAMLQSLIYFHPCLLCSACSQRPILLAHTLKTVSNKNCRGFLICTTIASLLSSTMILIPTMSSLMLSLNHELQMLGLPSSLIHAKTHRA